jgi:hypothetical protein
VKPERRPPVVTSDMQIGPDVDLDREDIRLGDGTRLTNELAEEINEDVRRAAGRPSLSGGRKHSPQVSARITLELQAELRDYSKRSGLSPSQVLRRALEELMGGRPPADMPGKQPAPTKRPRRTTRKGPASRSLHDGSGGAGSASHSPILTDLSEPRLLTTSAPAALCMSTESKSTGQGRYPT